jgi:hypothetical protein
MRVFSVYAFTTLLLACSADVPMQTRGGNPSNGTGSIQNPSPGSGFATAAQPGLVPLAPATPITMTGNAGATGQVAPSKPRAPISIDQTGADNPAGLSAAEVAKLKAGGPVGSLKFLYPYEATVFPRGLLPPQLMWDGAANADVAYVHIKAHSFEYSGVLKVAIDPIAMQPQLTLPEDIWAKAGQQTNGKTDPFALELSARVNGAVAGPITLHFIIAQATVKGSIYYNSYASKLPGAALGGNVLRIPAGGKVELFNSLQCNGCHSVSADGSKMLSQIELTTGGNAYDLVSGGPANPSGMPAGQRVSFGALYPDGSKYLATSTAVSLAHAEIAQPPGASAAAALFNSATGQVVPNTGIPEGAAMPMFSPDGLHLVFNDASVDNADAIAVMDYDVKTDKATNYRVLMRDSDVTRPGWPFFLPDAKAVVFTRTTSPDFSANGAYIGAGAFAAFAGPFAPLASAPVPGPPSDLYIADLATGTITLLAKAMGFNTPAEATSGTTTLPFPDDTHQSYFPTVAPIAAGGYFWVFFDGIRHYGNLGIQRQLWGAAIDISASSSYAGDPSHPAFYLPGQEFGAGNHRAFAALDPCKRDGDTCTSGIDCCGGSCSFPNSTSEFGIDQIGSCAPQQNSCARRDERCKTDADCCPPATGQPANSCIAGFCAYISLN